MDKHTKIGVNHQVFILDTSAFFLLVPSIMTLFPFALFFSSESSHTPRGASSVQQVFLAS